MALWLLRHGHTFWNGPPKRLQGRADIGLSMWGRADAIAWGEAMPVPARIVTSPTRRARETIAAAYPTETPPIIEDARLWELDNGDCAGLLEAEAAAKYPTKWRRWRTRPATARLGGGETVTDMAVRVFDALSELEFAIESKDLTLVVTNGGPIRTLICRTHGRSLDDIHAFGVDNLATYVVGPGLSLDPIAIPSLALAC